MSYRQTECKKQKISLWLLFSRKFQVLKNLRDDKRGS